MDTSGCSGFSIFVEHSLNVGTHEASTLPAVHKPNTEESIGMVPCLSAIQKFQICKNKLIN